MECTSEMGPPGTVIHHVPAATKRYVGCPSIVVLEDGTLLASHSYFGPGARNTDSFIYRSEDNGKTWRRIAELRGQIWSNLFLHRDELYMMGTDHCDRYGGRLNGRVVIRRSLDGGESWTVPKGPDSGVLIDEDGYHTAPVPVVTHDRRLWRSMEFAPEPDRTTWEAFVMSAPSKGDLLRRDTWLRSERYSHRWSQSQWIEGNVAVDRQGALLNILRTNAKGNDTCAKSAMKDKAAVLHVSRDGTSLHHDRSRDLIDLPGGGTKFTLRYDAVSDLYWVLGNKQKNPGARRNRLYLACSPDLLHWEVKRLLLEHPDIEYHAFQYVDWVFEGRDILFVSRTAYDDGQGGAHNFHDANYLTFHRIKDFRRPS